jgi:hypothetical protein
MTEPGRTPDQTAAPAGKPRHIRFAFGVVSLALMTVLIAPVLLSSQDLYQWGASPAGLALGGYWPLLVPVALDLAAVTCIGMTIVAAWRRERPGIFEALVWVFALTSAYAQYKHGIAARDAGGARDAWWAMPAFAVLGPVLLHVTLSTLRKWARQDAGEQHHGAAGFGSRWLPGVAFRETLSAWAASRREGISRASEAVAYVRERQALAVLSPVDQMHYAFGALGSYEPHAARVWLAARGVVVDQTTIEAATAGRPPSPLPVSVSPAGPSAAPLSASGQAYGPSGQAYGQPYEPSGHRTALSGLASKRECIRYAYSVLGRHDATAARSWLAEHGIEVSRSECHAVVRQSEESGSAPVLSVLPGMRRRAR